MAEGQGIPVAAQPSRQPVSSRLFVKRHKGPTKNSGGLGHVGQINNTRIQAFKTRWLSDKGGIPSDSDDEVDIDDLLIMFEE